MSAGLVLLLLSGIVVARCFGGLVLVGACAVVGVSVGFVLVLAGRHLFGHDVMIVISDTMKMIPQS